jgi:hypothetical protein
MSILDPKPDVVDPKSPDLRLVSDDSEEVGDIAFAQTDLIDPGKAGIHTLPVMDQVETCFFINGESPTSEDIEKLRVHLEEDDEFTLFGMSFKGIDDAPVSYETYYRFKQALHADGS